MELEVETAIKCKTQKITCVYTQWVTHINQSATEVLHFEACEIT